MSLFDLNGKVALVTGAASGLGKAIAETLAAQGAQLVLADINAAGLQGVADTLCQSGGEALPVPVDLGQRADVERLLAEAAAWQGGIDILVCCAGIEGHVGALTAVDDAAWQRLMTVNLQSALWLSAGVASHMQARAAGRIIYISSIAGLRGNSALGLYGIAKAGLSQMARNLAVELGPSGITVNAVAPGLIETPLSTGLMTNREFMTKRMAMTPLRRVGQPEEIAGVVVMLAARAGGFITGQTLVVDGGTLITDGN